MILRNIPGGVLTVRLIGKVTTWGILYLKFAQLKKGAYRQWEIASSWASFPIAHCGWVSLNVIDDNDKGLGYLPACSAFYIDDKGFGSCFIIPPDQKPFCNLSSIWWVEETDVIGLL